MTMLDIVHQDSAIVVVNKPSGLLSVPGRGPEMQDSVVSRLKTAFPDCIEQPSVHRLDMDTSGLLVLALTKEAQRHLAMQFEQRLVEKKYIALLDGIIEEEAGTIELAFRLDPNNRPHQVYDPVQGKLGTTHWQKLGTKNGQTLVEFKPLTGRTHQLRLHAAHEFGLGCPIVGDRLYGSGTAPGQLKLHATYLSFNHPETNVQLCFESSPTVNFAVNFG